MKPDQPEDGDDDSAGNCCRSCGRRRYHLAIDMTAVVKSVETLKKWDYQSRP
jgi:hypothetical protein